MHIKRESDFRNEVKEKVEAIIKGKEFFCKTREELIAKEPSVKEKNIHWLTESVEGLRVVTHFECDCGHKNHDFKTPGRYSFVRCPICNSESSFNVAHGQLVFNKDGLKIYLTAMYRVSYGCVETLRRFGVMATYQNDKKEYSLEGIANNNYDRVFDFNTNDDPLFGEYREIIKILEPGCEEMKAFSQKVKADKEARKLARPKKQTEVQIFKDFIKDNNEPEYGKYQYCVVMDYENGSNRYSYDIIESDGLVVSNDGVKKVKARHSRAHLSYSTYNININIDSSLSAMKPLRNREVIALEDGSEFFNNSPRFYLKFMLDENNHLVGKITYVKHHVFMEDGEVKNDVNAHVAGWLYFANNGDAKMYDEDGTPIAVTNYAQINLSRVSVLNFNEVFELLEKTSLDKYSTKFLMSQDVQIEKDDTHYISSLMDLRRHFASAYGFNLVEVLSKLGLKRIVNDINSFSKLDLAAPRASRVLTLKPIKECKNFYDLIGRKDKELLIFAQEEHIYLDLAVRLSEMRALDPTFSLELMREFRNSDVLKYRANDVINLLQGVGDTKFTVKRIMSYLENVRNYQCIRDLEAFTIWNDYLKMASRLSYDLTNKNIKYPSSLKKEHDITVFSFNKIKDELAREMFAESTAKYKNLEWKDKNLQTVVPSTPEEVVQEGKSLSHCVASYVGRITDSSTQIVFIRKNDEVNRPFYTMEIVDGVILQVKGFANCAPTTEVKDFVKAFAEKFKLARKY